MDTTADTFSTDELNTSSRDTIGADSKEPDSSYEVESLQRGVKHDDRQQRYSTTTNSTAGDYFEANEGRA